MLVCVYFNIDSNDCNSIIDVIIMAKKILTMKVGLLAAGRKIQQQQQNSAIKNKYQAGGKNCSVWLKGQLIFGAICGLILGYLIGGLF